ncbi:MAG: hypothetical protein NT090_01590 [Acidobacteria bacterium]|nr:hypothetical protein [Acidobacteriota bacterium]
MLEVKVKKAPLFIIDANQQWTGLPLDDLGDPGAEGFQPPPQGVVIGRVGPLVDPATIGSITITITSTSTNTKKLLGCARVERHS